ncbi:MAG TPA: class I adenylate-forming enzyme family protein [Candidatus Deferrimicrobiaceae bacterium]|nr:class I adenylate-forming enzyme family protein [Candidatus Deferrimicrobiaceae bacterium]
MTREVSARASRYRRHGLHPGDRVFLHFGNRLEFFAELLALWRLGAVAVPVDGGLKRAELERLAELVAPRFSVVDDATDARALPPGVAVLDATEALPAADLPEDAARPGADALVLFTSGSSGVPKGVVHTHASLAARWLALRRTLGLAAYARTLCLLPTHFGHGLICNSLFPWLGGQDLFITPPFRPDLLVRLGALIDEHRISFLSSVPALWRLALRVARPSRGGTLRRVHCGSAPLPAALWAQVQGWAGTPEVFNTYGLTETGSWVAGTSVGEFQPADGLIGLPWGATLHVTRPTDGGACGPGEIGHVWIESPALMRGYLGQDELTRRAIVNGRFATGDLGLLDERGWLHLRGRERDEINKGGMKISPAEVDAAAEGCPRVADVCAFALDDPLYGQNVGLAVALTAGDDAAVRDLYRWMRERLNEAKLPARWWLVDAIPRSERGKVSRDAVRDACVARPPLDLTRILQGR